MTTIKLDSKRKHYFTIKCVQPQNKFPKLPIVVALRRIAKSPHQNFWVQQGFDVRDPCEFIIDPHLTTFLNYFRKEDNEPQSFDIVNLMGEKMGFKIPNFDWRNSGEIGSNEP